MDMDKDNGGQTPEERQRATAAEIARRKVLESYGAKPPSSAGPKENIVPVVNNEDWKKYHSAWQDYYQKYYGKYYHQAARDYVEKEKLKLHREQAEKVVPEVEVVIERQEGGVKGAREEIRKKASGKALRIKKSRHFVPILIGVAVILVALLVQYYRVIVAATVAYIAPGNGEVNSITEIDPTVEAAVGPEPRLIIPKINVDVPIVFDIGNDQASLQRAMANGVAHFAVPGASAMPGEVGNLVLSGHSANGVFETGDYKFIFAPLERLANGDTIYVNYQSKRYTYTVMGRQVVDPTDVQSLIYPTDKPLLTLITCVPLGTARQRLLMIAEQINPDPSKATESQETPSGENAGSVEMPGNSPTFFEGVWNFLTGQ
ncbi:sortase [Christensenellaceae bacterium OttesenSCG-928-L17]|nr:sortase [Christensenellaceae bacterium OttesenSCG-928-L17]